MEGELAGRERA